MIEIKYNYFIRDTRGGEKCSVLSIEQISPSTTNEKSNSTPCIQTYDNGVRRDGTHGDYSSWNGTIFIDIDSKKFNKEFKFIPFKQGLISGLEVNYPQNYCWNQISSSGNSIHIVLYFSCERNETNFKKCCILAKNILLSVAKKCGEQFVEILNYPAVLDDCTSHTGQPLYISAYPIEISNYQDLITGECNLDDIEIVDNEYTEQEIEFNSDAKYSVSKILDELPDYEYKSTRWPLLWIILNYFNFDYNKSHEVWSKILPLILRHREDYTEKELWSQFDRDFKSSKGKSYAFKSVLLEWVKKNLGFKYTIKRKFEPLKIDLYNPDIEYTLDENEYLSNIDIKFSEGFNHIFAGCGSGKTVFGIEYGKKKKVCFITPMTSINKNSFSRIDENWLIVDSNYKDEVIHICGSVENALLNKNWSICTTWESFALYEMYKYNFDAFIIDESHTMYLYDYRIKSIKSLKQALNRTHSKVIFMSGTPSYEIYEFDCYKIKINKEIVHVPCDIVFYNNQYKGYVYEDIKTWTNADENNLAIVFYDKTNYRTEEDFKYYGLEVDIFNKNYRDNTDYILKNENVKKQITAFSVYGQAGINIYIDTNKKIRMYILNTNALSIIQYANRVRNKEVIDKVVIPYKIERIDNRIKAIDEKANFEEALNKVQMINEARKVDNKDVFKLLSNRQLIELKFGLPTDVLGVVNDEVVLQENLFETWSIIQHVCEYESQIQLIYNHLISNQFKLNFIYLDNDVKTKQRTCMRSNQFAGQMLRFDYDMIKASKDNSKLYLEMNKNFEKVAVGNTKDTIEYILNTFWNESNKIEEVKLKFYELINRIVREKGTIKKIDLVRYGEFLHICKHFHEYIDNAFLIALLNPELSVEKATGIYMRYIWSDKIDWKSASDEVYEHMNRLKKIVSEYHEFFEANSDVSKLNIENDEITSMVYTYVIGKHSGKKSNGVVINGVKYDSQREAAQKLGKSLGWVNKHKDV